MLELPQVATFAFMTLSPSLRALNRASVLTERNLIGLLTLFYARLLAQRQLRTFTGHTGAGVPDEVALVVFPAW